MKKKPCKIFFIFQLQFVVFQKKTFFLKNNINLFERKLSTTRLFFMMETFGNLDDTIHSCCDPKCSWPCECAVAQSFLKFMVDDLHVKSSGLNEQKLCLGKMKQIVETVIQTSFEPEVHELLQHLFSLEFVGAVHLLSIRICDMKYYMRRVIAPTSFLYLGSSFKAFNRIYDKLEIEQFIKNGKECSKSKFSLNGRFKLFKCDIQEPPLNEIVQGQFKRGVLRGYLDAGEKEYNTSLLKEIIDDVSTTLDRKSVV